MGALPQLVASEHVPQRSAEELLLWMTDRVERGEAAGEFTSCGLLRLADELVSLGYAVRYPASRDSLRLTPLGREHAARLREAGEATG